MIDLTVVILTKNEEENITDVIKNAANLTKKILIVDSGSTDKTVELAKEAGAKVVYRAWDNDFSAQRNFALDKAETKWVLYLDADERLNDELIDAIKKATKKDDDIQYKIKRKSVAFGRKFNYGVLKPDFVPRLFKSLLLMFLYYVHEDRFCEDYDVLLKGYFKH